MTKQQLIKKYFNQKEKLTLKNPKYKKQVKWFVDFMLNEDLDTKGDITTDELIKGNPKTTAIITAKENGIVAGLEEARWLITSYKLQVTSYKKFQKLTNQKLTPTKKKYKKRCGKMSALSVNLKN